jgi:hypothetical protein
MATKRPAGSSRSREIDKSTEDGSNRWEPTNVTNNSDRHSNRSTATDKQSNRPTEQQFLGHTQIAAFRQLATKLPHRSSETDRTDQTDRQSNRLNRPTEQPIDIAKTEQPINKSNQQIPWTLQAGG